MGLGVQLMVGLALRCLTELVKTGSISWFGIGADSMARTMKNWGEYTLLGIASRFKRRRAVFQEGPGIHKEAI